MKNNKKTLPVFAPNLLALFRTPINAFRQSSSFYLAAISSFNGKSIINHKSLALLQQVNLYRRAYNSLNCMLMMQHQIVPINQHNIITYKNQLNLWTL